jgi:hypothetical protein
MKTNSKKKTFDCVKIKNEIQTKIYKTIKNMTVDERLEFFNSSKNRITFGR